MTGSEWLGRYQRALDLARSRSDAATSETDLIACGFTNNVDLVVTLDDETLARLVAGRNIDLDGPRQVRGDTPDQLVTAICQYVSLGEGFDLPVNDPATHEWLLGLVSGRRQLGGTGAQVANTLAWLGFPVLVHLTGCSPEQTAMFDKPENVLVPGDGQLRPVTDAVDSADPTMWHVALEYVAGLRAEIGDRVITAPADSRVIVSFDPVNSTFSINPAYVDAVAVRSGAIRKALISGYTQIVGDRELQRLVDESLAAVRRWNATRPGMVIHVELGAMTNADELAAVVNSIAPEVTSIGMNADEFLDLTGVWGIGQIELNAARPAFERVRERVKTPRIGVHSAGHACALTSADPETERDALLFGALVASTRARIGRCPTVDDLGETLRFASVHASGLRLIEELGLPDGIGKSGGDAFVVVPTIAVPKPAATVGLGDSFTAGVLAML